MGTKIPQDDTYVFLGNLVFKFMKGTYMSYPEFREELFHALERMVSKELQVEMVQTQKLNGCQRFGISFIRAEANYSPIIYLEPFYRSFQKGEQIEKLAEEVLTCYREELTAVPESVYKLKSFESAAPNIYCKLINLEKNLSLLQDTPHITFLDFAIVPYFEVDSDEMYKGTVLLRDQHIDDWSVTKEQLVRHAIANTRAKKGVLFMPMSDVLSSLLNEQHDGFCVVTHNEMFVLTNQEKYLGAMTVYDPEVLSDIAEQLEDDFYLLPSSVHEWVIVPASYAVEEEHLVSTVRNINRSSVLEEEILSDHIYRYNRYAEGEKVTCIKKY